jgi:hypothetical protein
MEQETGIALTDGQDSSEKKSKSRVHTTKILPSERHNFGFHFELLKRFVIRTRNGQEGVSSDKVEGDGIPVQTAQMNVRFLRDIGLLTVTGRGLYLPTPEAIKFVMARSADESRAKPILRDLLTKTWFGELAAHVFQLQPTMTEDQFVSELALESETDKGKKGPALRIIIEYLVYAGILNRDDKGLTYAGPAGPGAAVSPPIESQASVGSGFSAAPGPLSVAPAPFQTPVPTGEWSTVQTESFQVRVRSNLDAVDELSDYVATLRRQIERKLKSKGETDPSSSKTAM